MTRRDPGMALAVVLVLLTGLALLAVTGLGGAVAALSLSGFDEQASQAFEAAEAGIRRSLHTGLALASEEPAWPGLPHEVTLRTEIHDDPPGVPATPPPGFSLGHGGQSFALRHHRVLAEGRGPRGALVRIEQGYAVIVPERGAAP